MNYIKGFDGLRAISIAMVFVTHLGVYNTFQSNTFIMYRIVPITSGSTGVNIFFVISGFLITRILYNEKLNQGRINFKRFFIRRFLRLLPPLIIFYLSLIILMLAGLVQENYIGFVISVFYLYNFVPKMYYTGELGPTWSLAVEEQFYLIWPFIVSFLNRNKIILVSIIILFLSVLSFFIYPLIEINWNEKIYNLTDFSHTQRWILPAIASIMIGSITSLYFDEISKFKLFKNSRLSAWLLSIILIANTLYLPFSLLPFSNYFHAIGVSIILVLIITNQQSRITKLLEFSLLRYIGRISYGLYIYHGLFIRTAPTDKIFFQKFPLNLFLTIIVSIISYHFIEKKILRYKNRFQ